MNFEINEDKIKEVIPGYNHLIANDIEVNLKVKVDSTELDLVLAALKEVSLELSKINSVLDSMVNQCARGQVVTAMYVTPT